MLTYADVQVAYGVGKLRVSSEELLARRERPPETIEKIDENTGEKYSEENPALRLWEDQVLRPKRTRLLHASYTPLTRLLHASYTPRTRLLHASSTPLPRLFHASSTPLPRLVHASYTPRTRLLHASYRCYARNCWKTFSRGNPPKRCLKSTCSPPTLTSSLPRLTLLNLHFKAATRRNS